MEWEDGYFLMESRDDMIWNWNLVSREAYELGFARRDMEDQELRPAIQQ